MMLRKFALLFKSDWEHDYDAIQIARKECLDHTTYGDKNKILLVAWAKTLIKAKENIEFEITKTGKKDDPKIVARNEFLKSSACELEEELEKQTRYEVEQETNAAITFLLGMPLRAALRR